MITFQASGESNVICGQLRDEIRQSDGVNPRLGAHLDIVIERLMAVLPEEGFQTGTVQVNVDQGRFFSLEIL